ncbi:hypothetical protein FDJ32_gp12 [Pseudomonas phage NV1]|uniref:Uncharacterized protein n=1 Tax=Pseudomonas phage NV1 TaxID=2079543 RepID=A0A2L0HPP1_9CAUD|nr:hypothetical protein FDJ32_gp12 [Pseudomonas phage NV1]AUX83641.1 hypothetical protein NV1_p12 [Pseudomonas phage NV1]
MTAKAPQHPPQGATRPRAPQGPPTMGLKITVNHSAPISGLDCKIGSYYRRASEPKKLYICSRDVSHDRVTRGGLVHGRMLVSLTHGNRMTANMATVDFIEVDVEITATDSKV